VRALLVVNPNATTTTPGGRDVIIQALGSELKLDVLETTHRGHAALAAAEASADGFDVVLAHGGDGTVNEVVNGLLHDGPGGHVPPLAVVPGGSTNVFSRALGRARDPLTATREVLDSLRAGRTRRISLGTASVRGATTAPARLPDPALAQSAADAGAAAHPGWSEPRWFAFSAGLGFDADVIGRVEAHRARGLRSTGLLYVLEATSTFVFGRERRDPAMSAHLPGGPPLDGLFLCLVSNVSPWTYLGARAVNPTPDAAFDSGLDVFALGRTGIVRMLHHVREVFAARPDVRGGGVHRWHDLDELTLTARRPQGWQLDGDHLGTATGLQVRSVPSALTVIA